MANDSKAPREPRHDQEVNQPLPSPPTQIRAPYSSWFHLAPSEVPGRQQTYLDRWLDEQINGVASKVVLENQQLVSKKGDHQASGKTVEGEKVAETKGLQHE